MLGILLLATTLAAPTPLFTGEPFRFNLAVTGSPYDAATHDIRVRFSQGNDVYDRPAYFDGKGWRAHLVARRKGTYQSVVYKNGTRTNIRGQVRAEKGLAARVRIENGRFRLGSEPYWPIGHNLGWSGGGTTVTGQLARMGKNGMNWARIWTCHWDNKNPMWPQDGRKLERDLAQDVLAQWDQIVDAAEKSGVYFQWVLFHHGPYSTQVNPNWGEHPWNAKNGGFLEKPQDFFSHPEAKRRTKNFLRYVVARYGHRPGIMSWELFNEVEWVDRLRMDHDEETVGKWHDEMAAYLRSLDPVKRLVTSSSDMKLPIYRSADYYQPHAYPADVGVLVSGAEVKRDKPFFFGEVGLGGDDQGARNERMAARDGIWNAFLAGHDGAAQYWYWDRVVKYGFDEEFGRASAFLRRHRLLHGPRPKPFKPAIQTRAFGAVRFSPGGGWEPTRTTDFRLPGDLDKLAGLSTYVQGSGKRDMLPRPIRFKFNAPSPGKFRFQVGTVARQGAQVLATLNGKVELDRKFEASAQDQSVNQTMEIDFPAGENEVTLFNEGLDWWTLPWVSVDHIGQAVTGLAADLGRGYFFRLERAEGLSEESVRVKGLRNGTYRAVTLDLETGKEAKSSATVRGGELRWKVAGSDEVVWITR